MRSTRGLSSADHSRLDELAEDLAIIKIGAPSTVKRVLGELRVLAELDSMACVSPVERMTGWGVERFECDNFPSDTKFRQTAMAFLESAPRRFGWYDAVRPESPQRNVVLEIDDLVPRDELESSALYSQLLVPLRLQHTHQIRALICEGSSLLAWFGAFHCERATRRQLELLIALVPALRRRLSIERQLEAASTMTAALDTALDQLGVPAFVIGASGRVVQSNSIGKDLLDARRSEVSAALRSSIAQRPSTLQFELTQLREHGGKEHWLATLKARTPDTRVAHSLARAVGRFKLTPRQRDVLELLVRGETNTAIAAQLGITDRAVEQHMSAMFVRTNVDNRAALVALVLLGK